MISDEDFKEMDRVLAQVISCHECGAKFLGENKLECNQCFFADSLERCMNEIEYLKSQLKTIAYNESLKNYYKYK